MAAILAAPRVGIVLDARAIPTATRLRCKSLTGGPLHLGCRMMLGRARDGHAFHFKPSLCKIDEAMARDDGNLAVNKTCPARLA